MARRMLEDPIWWMLGFALAGVAVALPSGPDPFLAALLGTVGAVLGLIAFLSFIEAQPYDAEVTSAARPSQVLARVRERFGRAPWSLARQEPDELVYWRHAQLNVFAAVVGFLLIAAVFGPVVAGVLVLAYIGITLRRTQTIVIRTVRVPDGTRIEAFVSMRGHKGRQIVDRLLANLHREPSEP